MSHQGSCPRSAEENRATGGGRRRAAPHPLCSEDGMIRYVSVTSGNAPTAVLSKRLTAGQAELLGGPPAAVLPSGYGRLLDGADAKSSKLRRNSPVGFRMATSCGYGDERAVTWRSGSLG